MTINRKQIGVIGLIAVLVVLLFSLDIKGLIKKDKGQSSGEAANNASQMASISLESISISAKQVINAGLAAQISDLEKQLSAAGSDAEKANLQRELARKWDDVNQPAPGAFYYEMLAESGNALADWISAGDHFTSAYENTQDTLIQPALVAKAINSYQKALEIQPNNLEAKTGLGVAYVNGTPNPMEGIGMLLEVVKTDPENVKANMSLGLFSMKSGQFEKAVPRFKTVLSKEQKPEAWFYLASAYENLGEKENAIAAYEKSKELAADPGLSKFVDSKIQELRQ